MRSIEEWGVFGTLMEPDEVWGHRWERCENPLARRYMEVTCKKQSLVILAADLRTMDELKNLIRLVGPHIAALKTHVDFCLLYTSPSPRDATLSRMPSSA